ncbi:MAG: hypothetical protein JKY54_08495, partial [Flavobacteriales bacterium]|nr:hypothetical protein [Flavobacteriales bacterium]
LPKDQLSSTKELDNKVELKLTDDLEVEKAAVLDANKKKSEEKDIDIIGDQSESSLKSSAAETAKEVITRLGEERNLEQSEADVLGKDPNTEPELTNETGIAAATSTTEDAKSIRQEDASSESDVKDEMVKKRESTGKDRTVSELSKSQDSKDLVQLQHRISSKEIKRKLNYEGTSTLLDADVEGIIVANAGLVLVHPFMKNLLSKLSLLNDNNELIDKVMTAHLLHYIATGKECAFEHEMIFEKYLSGIPIQASMPKEVVLTEDMKAEVDLLLNSVLTHWKGLKSNSIELLRNEFLQRSGKLILNEEVPRIVFERKVFDLMLDKLPWALSMVKLPWRKQLIFIEW